MSRRKEKAAATRRQLMDATFECLVEKGYHGTSTVAVCERAKLARGTMLHHFPTKEALVLASIEDLLVRRVEEFRGELEEVKPEDLGALVHSLWAVLRGPTFVVWLELALASRTNKVIAAEFRSVMNRFDELVTGIVGASFPADIAGTHDLHTAVSLVFSSLNGLALDLLQVEPAVVEKRVDLLASWVMER